MNLRLSYADLADLFSFPLVDNGGVINSVSFDTRSNLLNETCLFIAIKGSFRDGHDFLEGAYNKGVRLFLVQELPKIKFAGAQFIVVKNTTDALQKLAKHHRSKFNIPVIAITGSAGKTIVKEWSSQLLRKKYNVTKSPKSYNSQVGVPLAVLELTDSTEIAVFEAGISKPGEMQKLEEIIQPTVGVLTSIGTAHLENFDSKAQLIAEKIQLFKHCKTVISTISIDNCENLILVEDKSKEFDIEFSDKIQLQNTNTAITIASYFEVEKTQIQEELPYLHSIAMRLETFDGIQNSTIINDTYNLDLDAFHSSLEYLIQLAGNYRKLVLVGLQDQSKKEALDKLLRKYPEIEKRYINNPLQMETDIDGAFILVKGDRASEMERHANLYKLKKHSTYLEINLTNLVHNIGYVKKHLPGTTKVLCMIKASSYGSGSVEVARHLELSGADYFGVAYVDEGVELRKQGIRLPILVMNVEPSSYKDCLEWNLEPAIHSMDKLDSLADFLVSSSTDYFPIHLKLETGMNRLGFHIDEMDEALKIILSQPEIRIKSVYTHLSDADNPESTFVTTQYNKFNSAVENIRAKINTPFIAHILNSEGALNYPEYAMDMVRVGIAMYGYSSNPEHQNHLENVVSWKSEVSQIRNIPKNESVGYGRKGQANEDRTIAIIPVGYADGYRRILSDGYGGVYIHNQFCPTVGNVCMDMIMVDVTNMNVQPGDEVEIIGAHQPLQKVADLLNTIPYEVLTSISKRVHRLYISE